MITLIIYLLVVAVAVGLPAYYAVKKSRATSASTTSSATSGSTTTATTTTPPTPAPVASSRSYGWLWWVLIIAVVAYGGRWAWYETQGMKSTVSVPRVTAPGREMQQKFSAVIDPLSFNRQKSRGVRVENIDGGTTIVIEPHGELVYDIKVSGMFGRPVFIDFHRRETEPQYVGYRVNDIRHRHIFITATSGMSRYGTDSREFRTGENEIAFFSEGGRINMNGDKKITVYQK